MIEVINGITFSIILTFGLLSIAHILFGGKKK